MIELTYTKAILNALFHTGGSAGMNPDEEKRALTSKGVKWGVQPEEYRAAFLLDDYSTNGPSTRILNEYKNEINKSSWWYTMDTSRLLPYTDATDTERQMSFPGWTVAQRTEQVKPYPNDAYLALFTEMPDENGTGYVEPITDSEGVETTYMRVNLNESLLTGGKSMSTASKDAETGAATIANSEIIIYPEVYGVDWGTIIGIGVFSNSDKGTGTPIFWGRVNQSVPATTEHVPLFRVGDLKVTLK